MKEFVPVLKKTKLFAGVGDEEIVTMLSCLGASLCFDLVETDTELYITKRVNNSMFRNGKVGRNIVL